MSLARVGELETDQDLDYERRSHRVRKASVVVGLLLLAGALLGVFGTGPLSAGEASDGDLRVRYERFTRFGASAELVLARNGDGDSRNLAIARAYLADMRIEGIVPELETTTVLRDRVVYTFNAEAGAAVAFALTPREAGRQAATVWGAHGRAVSFVQWVYP